MDLRVIGVLLLIPLLDIVLLVAFADWVGAAPTVLIVVLTALLGMLLVRAEGRHTVRKIQRSLARGELPGDYFIDGGLLVAAAAFLLTPGLVTDLVGFLLVIPPTRYPLRLAAKRFVITPFIDSRTGGFATGGVYLGGFPDQKGSTDYDDYTPGGPWGGPGGSGGPGSSGGSGGPGGSGGAGRSTSDDDTVDLGDDEYRVGSDGPSDE